MPSAPVLLRLAHRYAFSIYGVVSLQGVVMARAFGVQYDGEWAWLLYWGRMIWGLPAEASIALAQALFGAAGSAIVELGFGAPSLLPFLAIDGLRAVLRSRPRPPKPCPRCAYELAGLEKRPRCPECGTRLEWSPRPRSRT